MILWFNTSIKNGLKYLSLSVAMNISVKNYNFTNHFLNGITYKILYVIASKQYYFFLVLLLKKITCLFVTVKIKQYISLYEIQPYNSNHYPYRVSFHRILFLVAFH